MGYYDKDQNHRHLFNRDKNNSQYEQRESQGQYRSKQGRQKSNGRGAVSLIAAGLVGGLLSLSVTQIPYIDNMLPSSHQAGNVTTTPNTSASGASNNTNNSSSPVVSNHVVETSAASSDGSVADMVAKVSKTIVGIENQQQQQTDNGYGFFSESPGSSSQDVTTATGSGIVFKKSGRYAYIVTNNHVIEGANRLVVSLADGTKTTAQVVGADALTDLAVLKIDGSHVHSVATFGDSTKLRAGDQVYAIGNPLGENLDRTVTAGIVSAVNRTVSESTSAGEWNAKVIQTDAAINPGNSGGALINTAGQVIGINSSKIAETGVEGIGFAIPSQEFIPIVNEIIKTGKVERPYMGVSLADLSQVPTNYLQNIPNNATQGVYIAKVESGSAADQAGLKSGDIIVSINNHKIKDTTALREYMYNHLKVGDDIKVTVYRNGQEVTCDLVLQSQP